jgi:hypothetical protein
MRAVQGWMCSVVVRVDVPVSVVCGCVVLVCVCVCCLYGRAYPDATPPRASPGTTVQLELHYPHHNLSFKGDVTDQ